MKCRELDRKCAAIGEFVGHLDGTTAGFSALSQLLAFKPDDSVAKISTAIGKAAVEGQDSSGAPVAEVVRLIQLLSKALTGIAATALTKDMDALVTGLSRHEKASIEQVLEALARPTGKAKSRDVEPMRDDVVRKYLSALESSLGDDAGFTATFKALEDDPLVQTSEAIALAKCFAFARATSRKAAIKKIWSRHQNLMTGRAKSAATAGRIAG